MMAQTYNRRHRVVEGETIAPGDRVWIPDRKTHGKVVRNLQQPRPVLIETTRSCVRRNRRMLRRLDLPNLCQPTSNKGQDVMTEIQLTSLQPDGTLEVDDHEHPPVIGHYDEQSVPEPPVSRKYDRATRKPTRYIEECYIRQCDIRQSLYNIITFWKTNIFQRQPREKKGTLLATKVLKYIFLKDNVRQ